MGTHLLFAVEVALWRYVKAGAGCWNTGASPGCACSCLHATTLTSEHGIHASALIDHMQLCGSQGRQPGMSLVHNEEDTCGWKSTSSLSGLRPQLQQSLLGERRKGDEK